MIINQIKLDNFGLYAGTQEVDLTPKKKKPIVLIGGLNGGGKTTFLDALQLCLFGGQAKTSNRNGQTYNEYLSQCIHRGGGANHASIEMCFNHTIEGVCDNYHLKRSWSRNGHNCDENLVVFKNGISEPTLTENWISQVDEFFPTNIANLFLFDGEQIEAYASLEDSPVLIRAAIQNLLGLDLVDQLESDLTTFEKRIHHRENVGKSLEEIKYVQDEIKFIKKELKKYQKKLDSIELDLKNINHEYNKADEKFMNMGGELYERSEDIKNELTEANKSLEVGKINLIELASGTLPLVLVRDLLTDAKKMDELEEESKTAKQLLDCLIKRDNIVLDKFGSMLDAKNLHKIKKFLDGDRKKLEKKGKNIPILNLTSDERDDINFVLNSEFKDLQNRLEEQLENHESLVKSADLAQVVYDSIPKYDSIHGLSSECDYLQSKINDIESAKEEIEDKIERKKRDLQRREQELIRLIEADTSAEGEKDDQKRKLHYSAKIKLTLSEFRKAIIDKHVHKIENLVYSCYKKLLRKEALITKITIDSESFRLTLYDRNTKEIPSERLSAGERQLLAIALLWGLAKASGRPLPTAIDTPLGRLDSSHRMNLIQHYLPHASHQVLLLSTDEEITGEYLKCLDPYIGRKYQLCYDDKKGQTTITEGYLK